MNKSDLIDAIAQKTGTTKVAAKQSLEATMEVIKEAIKAEKKVTVPGFGIFEHAVRAARKGVNPSTLKPIDIPAKAYCKLKTASNFFD